MQTIQFPLPKYGIDKLSDETSLQPGTWRSAVNVDISRAGQLGVREGFTRIATGEYHSAWYALQNRLLLASKGGAIYSINTASGAATQLIATGSNAPVGYCEYNGNLYIVNQAGLFIRPKGSTTTRPCGIPTPSLPTIAASANGGLVAGKYAVAISVIDANGEESGTCAPQRIELTANGGIQLTNLPIVSGARIAVFVTTTNGDQLYEYTQAPATLSSHLISAIPTGALARTEYLTPFAGGYSVRWHTGRLYVASGDTLWYSDPFTPHLTLTSTNFVQFTGTISFVEAVQSGIYVGDERGVWFLDGGDPTKFVLKHMSGCRAIPGTSVIVPNEHFNPKVVNTQLPVALWLSTSGYAVGTAEGNVVELNADVVRVPLSAKGHTAFAIRRGHKQTITLVNQSAEASGQAVDTTP